MIRCSTLSWPTRASDSLTILLGDGRGAFAPASSISLDGGTAPRHVIDLDVDGDGVIDLVTANFAADTVSILTANGDGTFQPAQTLELAGGRGPSRVAVADLDSDGRVELVTANEATNDLTILSSHTDGTFRATRVWLGGAQLPTDVQATDVNADGKPDLVIVNRGSHDATVLIGLGNALFREPRRVLLNGAQSPTRVQVTDLNSDGSLDLLTANAGTDDIAVVWGNGDGTFQSVHERVISDGKSPQAAALADFDGDGHLDVATANIDSNDVTLLLGQGNGTFGGPTYLQLDQGSQPAAIAAADLDGDGFEDLVTANSNQHTAAVLFGVGDGTFSRPMNLYLGGALEPRDVVVADFNLDGHVDLVTANAGSDDTALLLGRGQRHFDPVVRLGHR